MVVIAICGTPGTGKSLLADAFKKLNFEVIHLSRFVIENKLYQSYDNKRDAYVIDEEKFLEAINRYIESRMGKNIVIEGIGAECLPPEIVDICIVLTCEPFVLKERLEQKGFPPEKIEENLEAERFGIIFGEAVANYGSSKTIVVDTTYKSIGEVFDVILNELRKRGVVK